jgi:hypothetical protein
MVEVEMKKYRVDYLDRIEVKEIVKETEHFVTYEYPTSTGKTTRRETKCSSWATFFDSFEEAKFYLVTRETGRIESLKAQIVAAEVRLKKFLKLNEHGR